MKCFAAFSILATALGLVAWGIAELISAGMFGEFMIAISISLGGLAAVAAVVWAIGTAVECWSNR